MPAEIDFMVVKSLIIVPGSSLNGVMVRIISLDDNLTAQLTSSRSAGDLAQQLKCPFTGTKIGKFNDVSAITTPTSVTSGKSSPLATICVPMRISAS